MIRYNICRLSVSASTESSSVVDTPPEVLVEPVLDGERGEDGVVDEGGAQVGERARRVVPGVLVEVPRHHVVQHGVPEELQTLWKTQRLNWLFHSHL